jgi:hypothetical protein
MKFTITVSVAMSLASLALGAVLEDRSSPFEINIGEDNGSDNVVAWVFGDSKCNNVVLGPVSPVTALRAPPST